MNSDVPETFVKTTLIGGKKMQVPMFVSKLIYPASSVNAVTKCDEKNAHEIFCDASWRYSNSGSERGLPTNYIIRGKLAGKPFEHRVNRAHRASLRTISVPYNSGF